MQRSNQDRVGLGGAQQRADLCAAGVQTTMVASPLLRVDTGDGPLCVLRTCVGTATNAYACRGLPVLPRPRHHPAALRSPSLRLHRNAHNSHLFRLQTDLSLASHAPHFSSPPPSPRPRLALTALHTPLLTFTSSQPHFSVPSLSASHPTVAFFRFARSTSISPSITSEHVITIHRNHSHPRKPVSALVDHNQP